MEGGPSPLRGHVVGVISISETAQGSREQQGCLMGQLLCGPGFTRNAAIGSTQEL